MICISNGPEYSQTSEDATIFEPDNIQTTEECLEKFSFSAQVQQSEPPMILGVIWKK